MPVILYNYREERAGSVRYFSVTETAKRWGLSERAVRNYCASEKIPGAFLTGKTWNIPENAVRPGRIDRKGSERNTLPGRLRIEKRDGVLGGIYEEIQVRTAEECIQERRGSLTEDQIRTIFETGKIGSGGETVELEDVITAMNSFCCIDLILDNLSRSLNEHMIQELHRTLKSGTQESRKDWYALGEYKKLPNHAESGTGTAPKETPGAMKRLLDTYRKTPRTLENLLDFQYRFSRIQPFQSGNEGIGSLILLRECLSAGITPVLTGGAQREEYLRGLSGWETGRERMMTFCAECQQTVSQGLNRLGIRTGNE